MDAIETIPYKGCTIKVFQDDSCESPNDWGNTDVFLVYDHRSFYVERKGFDPETINRYCVLKSAQAKADPDDPEYQNIKGELEEELDSLSEFDGYYIFPVYAYIHSGVALSLGRNTYPFTDPWDTSMRGFALISKTEIDYELNRKRIKEHEGKTNEEMVQSFAEGLIEEWNDYLSGNVYGFQWEDHKGNEVGSCWGFYGDPKDQLIPDAKGEIDYFIGKIQHRYKSECKRALLGRAPFTYFPTIKATWYE